MENTKILIEVRGGIVQSVKSNRGNVKIVIVDYDNIQGDETIVGSPSKPDAVYENIYEAFTDQSNPMEMEVRDELKRFKF